MQVKSRPQHEYSYQNRIEPVIGRKEKERKKT